MQSVPLTTKIVSSNPIHSKVYSIQHYVIKFVSDLRQDQWFSPGSPVSSINKTDRHSITEISLKVVLNTKNQIITLTLDCCIFQTCEFLVAGSKVLD